MKLKMVVVAALFLAASLQAPVGLRNLGNTCYQNGALQALYNVKGLSDFLMSPEFEAKYELQLSTDEFKKLIEEKEKRNASNIQNLENRLAALEQRERVAPLLPDLQKEKVQKTQGLEFYFHLIEIFDQAKKRVGQQWPTLSSVYKNLVKDLRSSAQTVIPQAFCTRAWDALWISSRLDYALRPETQQDSGEFLGLLLNSLAEGDLKDPKATMYLPPLNAYPSTPVHNLFDTFIADSIICIETKKRSIQYHPYLILGVPLSGQTLETCLDEYTKTETIEGVADCGNKPASKQLRFFKTSAYMIIQLNRFVDPMAKVMTPIKIPMNLILKPSWMEPGVPSDAYELQSVVVHQGTTQRGGHYVAYVKPEGQNQWFKCNDSSVSPLSSDQIKLLETQGYIDYQNETPYILFYKRHAPEHAGKLIAEHNERLAALKVAARLGRPGC